MIQYVADTAFVTFTFPYKGCDLDFVQWNRDKEAEVYAELLQEFVDNGTANVDGPKVNVSYDAVFQLSSSERRLLGLPELYPYSIYIQPKGLLRDSSFCYVVSFRVSKLGQRIPAKRQGAIIGNDRQRYILRREQFELVEAIDEYNALPAESKSLNGNLITFSRLKDLSQKARATLDKYLQKENVLVPSLLKIEIDKIGEDTYQVVPTMMSPLSDQFVRYLEPYQESPDNIALTDDDGNRVRVVLNDQKQEIINKIKKNYSHSSSSQLRALVDNPALYLDPDECDLSVFYSDRVIEIGLYKPKVYPFVSPFKSSWISYEVDDRVNGRSKITFGDEEDVDEFENLARRAKVNGESSVTHNDVVVNVDDALAIAKDAREKFAKRREKEAEQKNTLIIEENADKLGYKVDFSDGPEGDLYNFHPIEGLKPSIQLKQHQIEGVAWLQHLVEEKAKGCLLADDMGLGKTLQLLSLIDWYDHEQTTSEKPYLIVAPVSLLENWEKEYEKFFQKPRIPIIGVDANVARHFHKGVDKNFIQYLQRRQIILTNYETVRSYQFSFCAVNFSIIALDEAQKIKTPGTMSTNAIKALKGDFKVAMTGTPVENTMVDLWCIMDFCVPGLLGNCKEFAKEFQSPLKSPDADVVELGNKVRKKMGKYCLRRHKNDVAKELPDKHIRRVEYEMPSVQRQMYDDVVRQALSDRNSPVPPKGYMLTCIMRLRSVSDHPFLGMNELDDMSVDEIINASAKMKAILPILDDIRLKGEKVILFAERRDTQKILRRILKVRYQVNAHIINGETPTLRSRDIFRDERLSRQQAIDDFQGKNGFNAIVMSPIAAGMGLNIVGANHIVHYARHWNPAKENQATDRAYRIGQEKEVFVYYPMAISKGVETFDQTLDNLLKRKSQLATATLFPSERIEVNSEELFNALMGKNDKTS